MPAVALTDSEIEEIRAKYRHLWDWRWDGDAPELKIDPMDFQDQTGDNLLHVASFVGDFVTVQRLVRAGLDVNAIGDMGNTALHYAKDKNHLDIFEFLVANGARRDIRNEFNRTPDDY